MPWVKFTSDFDERPRKTVMRPHAPGVEFVTTACADAAVRAGKAKRIKHPKNIRADKSGKVIDAR